MWKLFLDQFNGISLEHEEMRLTVRFRGLQTQLALLVWGFMLKGQWYNGQWLADWLSSDFTQDRTFLGSSPPFAPGDVFVSNLCGPTPRCISGGRMWRWFML